MPEACGPVRDRSGQILCDQSQGSEQMLFLTEGAALLKCLSQHMARNKKNGTGREN